MGPERHRRMRRVLSTVVAVDIVVALLAVYSHAGGLTDGWDRTQVAAGAVEAPSPLAAANFATRRTGTGAVATSTSSSTSTTLAPTTSTSGPLAAAVTTATRAAPPRASSVTTRKPAAAVTSATAPPLQKGPGILADPTGDTFAAETDAPLRESRADIVRTAATYEPSRITFVLQVHRPTDPRDDERWAGNSTYALWTVDTNGDSIADYEVRYFLVDEENVGGYVSRPADKDEPVCGVTGASYSADSYKITVTPGCLGDPPSFTYQATMSYDTNPIDGSAAIATDTTPNKGWSPTVTRS